MNSQIHKKVAEKFARRLNQQKSLVILRQDEVYSRVPRIRRIDEQLANTGFSMFKAIISDKITPEQAVAEINRLNGLLKQEKEDLLRQHQFPQDYLLPKYDCQLCQDKGYIDAKRCVCYEKALIQEAYNESNLFSSLREQTFDKFDLSVFSDRPDPTHGGISPRSNMQDILRHAKAFIRNTTSDSRMASENLLLYGPSGLGKTYVSSCIANYMVGIGYRVLYQTSGVIFGKFDDLQFNRGDVETARYLTSLVFDVDLLIIDDLGTEFINSISITTLFRVINQRLLDEKSTIINTNFSIRDIKEQYGERLLSRLYGRYTLLEFFGEDLRIKMKVSRKQNAK